MKLLLVLLAFGITATAQVKQVGPDAKVNVQCRKVINKVDSVQIYALSDLHDITVTEPEKRPVIAEVGNGMEVILHQGRNYTNDIVLHVLHNKAYHASVAGLYDVMLKTKFGNNDVFINCKVVE